jgi:hypothetical protein
VTPDISGAVRIAWAGDGYESISVAAPRRGRDELDEFASGVADEALLNRTLHDLRTALRRRFDGTFDIEGRDARRLGTGSREEPHVLVTLHPPHGEPNPDPPIWDEFL